jgi:Bromodomain
MCSPCVANAQQLLNGVYADVRQFVADIRLVFSNALQYYTDPASDEHGAAQEV